MHHAQEMYFETLKYVFAWVHLSSFKKNYTINMKYQLWIYFILHSL